MKIRVYYEDTDAGGVVYHSNYLKFCERARSEIFFQKNAKIFDKNKGHFLLTKADCSFLKPARLGDVLEVKTYISKIKKASVHIHQEIFKEDDKLFDANFILAFIKDEKISIIQDEVVEIFKTLLKE